MRALILCFALLALTPVAVAAAEVTVYSYRQEALIRPFLERFTRETGIGTNLVTGKADALLQRLQSEGRNTPADLLITTDAGRLHRATAAGALQPVSSVELAASVPAQLRDPEGRWFALSRRARVIVYRKGAVDPGQLSSYEDLAAPVWRGRICVRSSDNIYNQSLLAAMIAGQGEAAAEAWARGMVANFARPPKGNDRAQIKAVAAGQCDVALVNNYYLGVMQESRQKNEREAALGVGLFYPTLNGRGTHINVSGAGVTRYAKNRDAAIRLLEFLLSEQQQRIYAEENHEYPVRAGVEVSALVRSWGGYPFVEDTVPMSALGEHNARAVMIFDRVGWK